MAEILMPKATAVWLVDNTALSFEQIAEFCNLHHLEVKGIADGDVAAGVRGNDPVSGGQLAREEIDKAEADASYRMKALPPKYAELHTPNKRRGPRYTPLSRRQNRPDAIAWLVRNHPELTDGQISKLIGTTKTTIEAVRERKHWNSSNIKPTDPVSLGLPEHFRRLADAVIERLPHLLREGLWRFHTAPVAAEGRSVRGASRSSQPDRSRRTSGSAFSVMTSEHEVCRTKSVSTPSPRTHASTRSVRS